MGWTVSSGVTRPNVAYIGKRFEQDNADRKVVFLDGSIVKLTEFYGVVEEFDKKTNITRRFPVAARIYIGRDKSFSIKEMSPIDMVCCPQKILNLLTYGEDAKTDEWIHICQTRLLARAALPKVGKGSEFDFSPPLRLVSGVDITSAEVEDVRGQRLTMKGTRDCSTRFRMSIPSLKARLESGSATPSSALTAGFVEVEAEAKSSQENVSKPRF